MKNKVFLISHFDPKLPNDPIPMWFAYINNVSQNFKITIYSLFLHGKKVTNKQFKIIPLKANLIKLYSLLKKHKNEKVYVIGSYFSNIIYLLLCPRNSEKYIYLVRNRIILHKYLKRARWIGIKGFEIFYLLSSINLGWIYRYFAKHANTNFLFPSITALDEFIKDTKIKRTKCKVILSPIKKINRNYTKKFKTKSKNDFWITYAGRASLNRGVKILIESFKLLHLKYPNTKLILLLLPFKHLKHIHTLLKTLPKYNYILKTKRLGSNLYTKYLSNADCMVAPFTITHDFPHRSATVLEAMSFGIPCFYESQPYVQSLPYLFFQFF